MTILHKIAALENKLATDPKVELREIQEKLHKLRLQRNKTDSEINAMEDLMDREQELQDDIEDAEDDLLNMNADKDNKKFYPKASSKDLATFCQENKIIAYDDEKKKEFKRLAMKYFRDMAKTMQSYTSNPVTDTEVSFNPGGIAVSGDISFRGMFDENQGFHLFFNLGGFGDYITYRSIKDMKDYSGGPNRQMPLSELSEPSNVMRKLYSLKKEKTASKKMHGVVLWFNDSKGYGFIESGNKHVFVHHLSITGDGFKTLSEGQKVEFELIEGPKGPTATNVVKSLDRIATTWKPTGKNSWEANKGNLDFHVRKEGEGLTIDIFDARVQDADEAYIDSLPATDLSDAKTQVEHYKVASYSLQDVIKTIEGSENDFMDDDGMYDKFYIMERFNLNKEQYSKVMRALDGHSKVAGGGGDKPLTCDMRKECSEPVTHVDDKGWVYCTKHGQDRKLSRIKCRKLTPSELRQLQSGKPLSSY